MDCIGHLALIEELRQQNALLLEQNIALKKQVAEQAETIVRLENRVTELERQLKTNSRNSSKPPSSDVLKKPKTTSLREMGQNKSGGQPGHAGTTLNQIAVPDEVIVHGVSVCSECKSDLGDEPVKRVIKRQVFDIPKPEFFVTEHQVEIKECRHCQKEVQGQFPKGVAAPVQYGNNLRSWIVYLQHQHFLPEDRLQQLLKDLVGLEISTASIVNFSKPLYEALEVFEKSALEKIKVAPLKHLDETGYRVASQTQWLHVASNAAWTYYHLSEKRKALLTDLEGTIIHDHWKPYYQLTEVAHGLCNAHHLRELVARIEEKEAWAKKMFRLLKFGLAWKTHYGGSIPLEKQVRFTACYDRIIAEGLSYHESLVPWKTKPERGRTAKRKGHNLVLRLRDYKADVLRFMTNPEVPFTNNQAEQDLRMMKVKQKIAGGFRTLEGAQIFVRVRSFISTLRKQGIDIFTSLTNAMQGELPIFA